jgi:hypothetical protein
LKSASGGREVYSYPAANTPVEMNKGLTDGLRSNRVVTMVNDHPSKLPRRDSKNAIMFFTDRFE